MTDRQTGVQDVPPGYKRAEVGVIPHDWDVDRIDNHASIKTGSKNTQDRIEDGDYPFFVRSQQVERINTYSYEGEAVLTAGDGVGTGKVFHYVNGRFDVHQRVYRISDFSDRLNGRYFFFLFKTRFYDRIMSMTAKSSVDSVRMEMIAGMRIPLPPLPEQRAIATALSDVDGLIGALDALIEKKRAIKQAAMQQLLTGKKRLPGFAGEWETKQLGDHATLIRNGTTYVASLRDGVPITRIETISSGFVDFSKVGYAKYSKVVESYKLQPGDILYSHINSIDHIGKVALVSDVQELYHGMNLLMIRSGNNTNSKWLFYVLNSDFSRNWARSIAKQAVSQASINTKEIKTFSIPTPPLPEQTAIAAVLSDMDAEIAALERRREKAKQIKQGMMQQLLTGRIRLPSVGGVSTQ